MGTPATDTGGARGSRRAVLLPHVAPAVAPATGADQGEPGELVCVSRGGRLLWVTEASKRLLGWDAEATRGG